MHIIQIGHITTEAPSKWNELTAKQLMAISAATVLDMPEHLRLQQIAISLCNIPRKVFLKLNIVQRTELYKAFDFLYKAPKLTKNLIPSVRIGIRLKFYGPADSLKNISVGEFVFAETHFVAYCKTNKPEAQERLLNKIIATLYRPKRHINIPFKRDPRVAFNPEFLDARTKAISKLSPEVKHAILLFYKGCRQEITCGRYEPVFNGKAEGNNSGEGLANLVTSLAGPKFGDLDKTFSTPLYTVLEYLRTVALNDESKKNK